MVVLLMSVMSIGVQIFLVESHHQLYGWILQQLLLRLALLLCDFDLLL